MDAVRTRWWPVLGLLILSPICAEYLSAYAADTGDALALLGGLLVLAPLYGAPALLAREVARHHGLGWPGMLLLFTALGLVQAGIIDQSIVNHDYRGFPEWTQLWQPTYVASLDLSFYALVAFTLGHAVASFAAPVLLVEVLSGRGREPWLGRWGGTLLALLYVVAWVILDDHLASEGWQLSTGQLIGFAVAAAVLVVLAFRSVHVRRGLGPGPAATWPVPPVWSLLLVGIVVESGLGWSIVPSALGVFCVVLVVVCVALLRWGRNPAWSVRHEVALAIGVLLSRSAGGFLITPTDGARGLATYTQNAVAVLLVLALAVAADRKTRAR